MYKTHNCGELRISHEGERVELAGWVHRRRDHGGLIFIDLRDRSGLVQVTVDPSMAEAHRAAEQARGEFVLAVEGRVRRRPEGTANPGLPTGQIEVLAESIEVLNPAKTLPLPVDDDGTKTDETLRLKYRYLDLRRARMQRNLALRHRTIKFIRDYLDDLRTRVKQGIADGLTVDQAKEQLKLPDKYKTLAFQNFATPNVEDMYKELTGTKGK